MPEITLPLPLAIGLVLFLLAAGAGIIFSVLRGTGKVVEPTPTATATLTPTLTITPTITPTATLEPTATPLPPKEYTVKAQDTCIVIAYFYNVTVNSIIALNNLDMNCTLSEGMVLKIPQPTPTPSPMPSSTLSEAQATDTACQKYDYTVKDGDTLSTISANFNVSTASIKSYNSMASDVVYTGMKLKIPLCERLPTAGPTPTPTTPPPYAAPNLLQPADGSVFAADVESITLQWASIGTLRQNETYAVSIEDITAGSERSVEYVADTKYIVPVSMRPVDSKPHVLRWTVVAVRQTGSTDDGDPIYEPAGAVSASRVFIWWSQGPASTPTP